MVTVSSSLVFVQVIVWLVTIVMYTGYDNVVPGSVNISVEVEIMNFVVDIVVGTVVTRVVVSQDSELDGNVVLDCCLGTKVIVEVGILGSPVTSFLGGTTAIPTAVCKSKK